MIPRLDRSLQECTIPAMLLRRAEEAPESPLVRCGAHSRGAREQIDAVSRTAGILQRQGVSRGDRVALLSVNSLPMLDVILAAAWMGAVAVPLNTALTPAQLRHALTNSGAQLICVDAAGLQSLTALDDYAELTTVWMLPNPTSTADGGHGDVADAVPGLSVGPMPTVDGPGVEPADVGPGGIAAILYTSGTTGPAKGVLCPHAQFYWWGRNMAEHMGFTADDVLFTTLPLFHTNALNAFMQAVVSGATFAVAERFSASTFWSQAAQTGATFTYLLGAMVGILLNRSQEEFDPAHRVRAALSPATPARMVEEFRDRFGVTLLDGFGSTETNFVIGVPRDEPRPGYMGVQLEGFEARVADEHGSALPDGQAGELLLRSAQPAAFARGYFNMPEETVGAWDDLWFHTGDRVVRESDGWFRFVDRIKDIIRRRGENISSLEVEEAARAHDDVVDAAAYAVASELGEEEVQLSIEVRPGAAVEPAELITFLEPRLPYFAVPRYLTLEDELPRTANGKVSKAVLRAAAGDLKRWDRQREGQRV
ncbi:MULTISPECIES: AMP-binding protein [Actinomycetes]|uniref:ATP-dependent acyl-CoA ligase n=2 Tax=Actinomycetes TaxID=1760 RepID=A0ABP6LXX9_9MICC